MEVIFILMTVRGTVTDNHGSWQSLENIEYQFHETIWKSEELPWYVETLPWRNMEVEDTGIPVWKTVFTVWN